MYSLVYNPKQKACFLFFFLARSPRLAPLSLTPCRQFPEAQLPAIIPLFCRAFSCGLVPPRGPALSAFCRVLPARPPSPSHTAARLVSAFAMQTQTLTVDPERFDAAALAPAVRLIRDGEVVCFPTETVYGVGANALSGPAVRKIFQAKGRPSDNPLIGT